MTTVYSRHCDIFRARDNFYYARLESAPLSEEFNCYGPFSTADLALGYLQQTHHIDSNFYLDDTGRRPVPAVVQPAGE